MPEEDWSACSTCSLSSGYLDKGAIGKDLSVCNLSSGYIKRRLVCSSHSLSILHVVYPKNGARERLVRLSVFHCPNVSLFLEP